MSHGNLHTLCRVHRASVCACMLSSCVPPSGPQEVSSLAAGLEGCAVALVSQLASLPTEEGTLVWAPL